MQLPDMGSITLQHVIYYYYLKNEKHSSAKPLISAEQCKLYEILFLISGCSNKFEYVWRLCDSVYGMLC